MELLKQLPPALQEVAIICFGIGIIMAVFAAVLYILFIKGILAPPKNKVDNVQNGGNGKKEVKDNILELVSAKGFQNDAAVNATVTRRLCEFEEERCKSREKFTDHQYNELNDKISLTNISMTNGFKAITDEVSTIKVSVAKLEVSQEFCSDKIREIGDKQDGFYNKIDKFMSILEDSHLTRR